MNWNNPNLWVFLIFVILPVLQWIAQRIKEQRDAAKARETIRRKQEEALRTGRTAEDERKEARQRAEMQARAEAAQREAMQRRQEQLRELRRKQMQAQAEARARARQSQPTPPRPQPTARVPAPPPPAPPAPPTPRPIPVPQQRQAPRAPQAPQRPARQRQGTPGAHEADQRRRSSDFERITAQRQAEMARRQAMLERAGVAADQSGEDAVRPMLAQLGGLRSSVAAPNASEATTTGADLLSNITADDWRRGIIFAEILAKPLAERDAPSGW